MVFVEAKPVLQKEFTKYDEYEFAGIVVLKQFIGTTVSSKGIYTVDSIQFECNLS